jgi:hypothetical protein
MNLVERAGAILRTPRTEWPVIGSESQSVGYLFLYYVLILAAIPPVSFFIGTSILGFSDYRVGFVGGLVRAVGAYGLMLVNVLVTAFIINALAGVFGAQKNFNNAMKVAIYTPTAAWLAGIFEIIRPLAFLSLIGIYSLYLLHTGITALMRPPADKALSYTVAVVLSMFAVWLVAVVLPLALWLRSALP